MVARNRGAHPAVWRPRKCGSKMKPLAYYNGRAAIARAAPF
jgi:hypothetical protein